MIFSFGTKELTRNRAEIKTFGNEYGVPGFSRSQNTEDPASHEATPRRAGGRIRRRRVNCERGKRIFCLYYYSYGGYNISKIEVEEESFLFMGYYFYFGMDGFSCCWGGWC